jgi:TRAP-type C4-dicarboxylate transport system substrate-binding protein
MSDEQPPRRRFLKMLGVSSAGVALTSAASASKEKLKAGNEEAKQEIEKLKKAYEDLDNRSKGILRVILVITGLDFFMD